MSQELVDAARDYLSRNLCVIALNGKQPNGRVHPHGLHDSLDSLALLNNGREIEVAFNHPLTTGIGILTRYPYFVVDIDGEEGVKTWKRIAGKDDYIPASWVVRTSRGLHLWFADWTARSSCKLGPLLDLKAEGGYVAAPPSAHPDGGKYIWLLPPGDDPPMEAPPGLIRLLDEQDALRAQKVITREQRKRVRHEQFEDGKWWATWGFEGLLKAVREMRTGERNSTLYWAAYTMTEDGADEEDFEQLREAAMTAGLNARETRLTVRSARQKAVSDGGTDG